MVREESKLNVLMVSMALQGHMNPMLKFAKRLNSKGVHVTLATTDVARHRMLKHNTTSLNNSEIQLEFFSDGLSFEFDRDKDTGTFLRSIYSVGPQNLSNLISTLTQSRHYACVIINPFVPWVVDVAQHHGIPCAMLWIQACALYSIYYRHYKSINSFPDLENPNHTVVLPGLPMLKVRDLPSFMLPSSPPHFNNLLIHLFKALDNVKWTLGASVYEIEEEIVKSMSSLTPIYPIGPLVSPVLLGEKDENDTKVDMWNAEASCMEWLEEREAGSVVYISFGSIVILAQKEMENMALALKNSGKAFLWVVKESEGEVARGVLEEETKRRGMVVRWCEQEKVLMHKAVGCFVTHCGWNSMLETVVAGVPVIGYPKWTDQPTNAKLASDVFKNGVVVEDDDVASSEELERCIREVMEGPRAEEMKKRALQLKEAAKKALEEGGSSDNNINYFLTQLTQIPQTSNPSLATP